MMKTIEDFLTIKKLIVAVVGLSITFLGGYRYLESRYALNSKLDKIEKRLELQILNDEIYQIQDRIWYLQDRLKENPDNETAQEELRLNSFKKQKLDEQLDDIYKSF